MLSLSALYVFGGEVLEPFAFTMLAGVIVSTYSTVFIASAIAAFLSDRKRTPAAAPGALETKTRPGRKARGARAS
jgi:preprotein translocase subunit SecF